MIYDTGTLLPTKEQLKLIREFADDSFCQSVPETFGRVPLIEGYAYCARELTALTLKNVEPHDDPWVGHHEDGDGDDGPEGRRAMFWVLAIAGDGAMHFQCGTKATRMTRGSWVLFDDRILHGVYSEKKWFGLAWQLRPI